MTKYIRKGEKKIMLAKMYYDEYLYRCHERGITPKITTREDFEEVFFRKKATMPNTSRRTKINGKEYIITETPDAFDVIREMAEEE